MSRATLVAALAVFAILAEPASAQTIMRSEDGAAVGVRVRSAPRIDHADAKPMPIPRLPRAPRPQIELLSDAAAVRFSGPPSMTRGAEGDGRETPVNLPVSRAAAQRDEPEPTPQEFGSGGQPYTTTLEDLANKDPHRRAGKLFIEAGGDSFVCSAALIDRGLIVTAAHCVAAFGERRFFDNWQFVPGYRNGSAPFGTWNVDNAYVPDSYYTGSAPCAVYGVTCVNDVAILVARPKGGDFPGQRVGWFGYGTNGFGFTGGGQALVTQLGYPGNLNRGELMIRTDSQGSLDRSLSDNTVIGSLQTGGSSGGPWIVNFGDAARLSGGLKRGARASRNVVVGVTSWGYEGPGGAGAIKQQGASPFNASLTGLIKDACKKYPRACN